MGLCAVSDVLGVRFFCFLFVSRPIPAAQLVVNYIQYALIVAQNLSMSVGL